MKRVQLPTRGRAPRRIGFWLGATMLLFVPVVSGCPKNHDLDHGANQSLVEIGERSLEEAEALENEGRTKGANNAYRRAIWAFEYHEKLTGEQPFLAEEAVEGYERTR